MRKDVRSSEGGKEQQGRSEPQELQPIFLLPPSSTPVTTSIAPITLPDSMTKIEKRESLLLSDPINTSIDDFSLLKVLGKGCMGKVHMCLYLKTKTSLLKFVHLGTFSAIKKKQSTVRIKIN